MKLKFPAMLLILVFLVSQEYIIRVQRGVSSENTWQVNGMFNWKCVYIYLPEKSEPSLRVLQVIRRYSDFDALNSSLMVSPSLLWHSTNIQSVCVCVWRTPPLCLPQSSVLVNLLPVGKAQWQFIWLGFFCITDFPEALAVTGAGQILLDCFLSPHDSHWYVSITDLKKSLL